MNIWLAASFGLMSIGWLIPNHQLPWTTFHADAWVGGTLLVVSLGLLVKGKSPQPWSWLAVVIAALSLVPLIQLAFGYVNLAGTAWMGTLYLLGFCVAILAGARWEMARSSEMLDALMLAVGGAATLSVGLQLCQWLNVSDGCLCSGNWIAPHLDSRRASANLSQPNQLATLLIWGILALCWAWVRKAMGGGFVIAGIVFLLLGLALTESRTGALSLSVIVLCSWYWRQLWLTNNVPRIATLLFAGYVMAIWSITPLSHALLLDYSASILDRIQFETRLDIWAMFLSAIWQRPWLGYGWDQGLLAQVAPTTVLPVAIAMHGTFYAQAHNLFLDLVVWIGVPLGMGFSIAVLYWIGRIPMRVKCDAEALLVMLLFAAGIHAMLELPLHHAYFLLPLGLVVGAIDVQMGFAFTFTKRVYFTLAVWLTAGWLFVVVVRDYFFAEESYAELRLESARVLSKVPRLPPDVVLLTQLREMIVLARFQPSVPMTEEKIEWIRSVALTYPTPQNLQKLAAALAINGHFEEAQAWLLRICELSLPDQCERQKASWLKLRTANPHLADIEWPVAQRR